MFYFFSFSDVGISPLAPPRNRNRQDTEVNDDSSHLNSQSIQPASNGLPPTPKVHMGACFSKVSKYSGLRNRVIGGDNPSRSHNFNSTVILKL